MKIELTRIYTYTQVRKYSNFKKATN